MKKLVWHGRNTVDVEDGEEWIPHPGKDEVLLKVRGVGICGTDIHILNGSMSFTKAPLILGHEISGEIAAVGKNVGNVREGDRVTVDSVVGCGQCSLCRSGNTQFCPAGFEFGITRDGGCQEYLVVPRRNVHRIPDSISFDEAAILDIEVYNAVNKCGIELGDRVLILGAGPIGLIACQVARILGAGLITLTDLIPQRLSIAETLGVADEYRLPPNDADNDSRDKAHEANYDVVIDCAGNAQSTRYALERVSLGGRILLYGVYEHEIEKLDLNRIVLKDLVVFGAQSDRRNWEIVIDLVTSGRLNLKGLITHHFPLIEGVRAFNLVRLREDAVVKTVLIP